MISSAKPLNSASWLSAIRVYDLLIDYRIQSVTAPEWGGGAKNRSPIT